MADKRKFSLFISSTYEDLKDERQALLGVALENGFIPVGMEQFHGAPTDQWSVITKMIDESDFYLLIIGGRYGSIDEVANIGYTEKEYDYAKSKGIPVLVLIKESSSITEDKKDTGNDRYEKMKRLDTFRTKVKNGGNTVDFFNNLDKLKYVASQTLRNAIEYADENSGWVRFKDIADVVNEEAEARNIANAGLGEKQQILLEDMKAMLTIFGDRLSDIEKNSASRQEMPAITKKEIDTLFREEGSTLTLGSGGSTGIPTVGKDDVGNIPVDSAFLLVYAADGDGEILKTETLSSPTMITTSGKQFMADNSKRESARWEEALDRLIVWGWVKPIGYKNEIFRLTGTGYEKAEWLKEAMRINTENEPLEELKGFE